MNTERLAAAMKAKGFNQSSLAKHLGVSQGTINQILLGTTKQSKHEPDIAQALGVTLSYLRGDDIRPGMQRAVDDVELIQLVEVDIGYGMGGGTFIEGYASQEMRLFDPSWLRAITRSPPEKLFIARGIGDSMFPTLQDSDTLVIDRGQRRLTQQDRVWALTYGELGMIKRVRRLPSGRYSLMSDNPTISPIDAAEDELNLVGRVVWVGRKM